MTTGRHSIREALLPLLLAAMALVLQTSAALAHAALASSTPQDGSVAPEPPAMFSLVFSEPVAPLSLRIVRPGGEIAELADFRLRDRTIEIVAPADLGEGTHVLAWRVVSIDGHPVGGSVVFSVGAAGVQVPQVPAASDPAVRAGLWLARIALYAGLFVGVGGVFARAVLMPGVVAGGRVVAAALTAGAAGAACSLPLQGLDALGAPIAGLAMPQAWKAGYETSFGATVLLAIAALVMAAAARCGGAWSRLMAAAALLAGAGSLALSGHASAAAPQWLMRPAVLVHAASIAVWIGALLPLGLALRRGEPGALPGLARFSAAIPAVVSALAASGTVLAVVQVGNPQALVATDYGRIFLGKLVLLAGLFALAARNRLLLTAPVAGGDRRAARLLARSIAAETLLAFLVFGAAAGWRFTPPPRVLEAVASAPAGVHLHGARAMAEITVSPGRAGAVEVAARISNADFGPLDAKEVAFVFANPAAQIEPFRRLALRSGDGVWRASDIVIPLAGTWSVRVDILITDFEIAKLEGEIAIRP